MNNGITIKNVKLYAYGIRRISIMHENSKFELRFCSIKDWPEQLYCKNGECWTYTPDYIIPTTETIIILMNYFWGLINE